MTFAQGLVDALEADAGLIAVLGAGVNMRLHTPTLPQPPVLPALVFRRISAARLYTLDDASRTVRARYQFDAWADDYLEAEQLGDLVIAAVSGYRATLSSGHRVDVAKVDNDLDDYEPETERSRRIVDVVWHYEEN